MIETWTEKNIASSPQAKTAGGLKLPWRKSIDCCNNSGVKSQFFGYFSQSIVTFAPDLGSWAVTDMNWTTVGA
jgi:hypothetical protein